ncbi:MAG: GPP34 family phosphoprotein [Candidatus Cloacimonetes bacterium]|jgi:hypothetical protein|nr:GPP34 family phosphoprotein [Candidatus Cloacimonadota bacterium]
MLNCAEELILLAIDDESGAFHRMIDVNFNLSLVGALIMDLALRNRIDSDLEHIYVISREPTNDPILDQVLEMIGAPEAAGSSAVLLRQLYQSLENLRDRLLKRLELKGIIRFTENRVLWLFKQRRYPVIDQKEEKEVLTRIRETVLTDVIPEPRDLALISLINSCDLMDKIFSSSELREHDTRIQLLSKMDLIGHSTNKIIEDVQKMIASAFGV